MTDERTFPYHKHCGYCTGSCKDVRTDSKYMLITNFWNESESIQHFFDRIRRQTLHPRIWLWIDDGSTDGSVEIIRRNINSIPDVEIWVESMPPKRKGNLDTIGRAFDRILPSLIAKINEYEIDYVAIMDTDNDPCPNYSARLLSLLDANPNVGAAAGIPIGEEEKRKSGLPMGGGKFIRWSIFKTIMKYWDIAPDTLLNIKALAQGYQLKTWRVPMNLDALTTAFSSKGVFRQGRLNYYVGRPFWAVLLRSIRRLILRQYGTQMLRGYLFERKKGTWRFDDPDTNEYYGMGSNPMSAIIDMLRYVRARY